MRLILIFLLLLAGCGARCQCPGFLEPKPVIYYTSGGTARMAHLQAQCEAWCNEVEE